MKRSCCMWCRQWLQLWWNDEKRHWCYPEHHGQTVLHCVGSGTIAWVHEEATT